MNFNQLYEFEFYKGNYKTHISSLDYWSTANPDGNHSAVHFSASQIANVQWSGYSESTTGGYGKILGRTWRRADYVRLKEASISYTWSGAKVREKLGVSGIKVYVMGNNLLTFTDLIEGDPESKNLAWGAYPHMRNIQLGIQLNF